MRSEASILAKVVRWLPQSAAAGVQLGIGDDCAIFRATAGEDLLFTTDLLIEDVHFRRRERTSSEIGHRAIARSLSDIAAMGGTPRFCLLALALPKWASQRWIAGFYRGFLRLAEETGTRLAGGDLSRAKQLTCDVMVCGAVPRGKALRRDGARPGDGIYVSGRLGKGKFRFAPRLSLGRFLLGRATSAIDLSDGLSLDLHRLCLASGVAASLDSPLPLARGASVEQALHAGEDYELLFTLPRRGPVSHDGIPLTRVGVIEAGRPGLVRLAGRALPPLGYDHFRQR